MYEYVCTIREREREGGRERREGKFYDSTLYGFVKKNDMVMDLDIKKKYGCLKMDDRPF